MEFKKLSETEIEATEVITRKAIFRLDQLLADRESLVRTLENNNVEYTKKTSEINTMIAEIDSIISEANKVGLKKESEVVSEVIEA